jgi:hypothetical protein
VCGQKKAVKSFYTLRRDMMNKLLGITAAIALMMGSFAMPAAAGHHGNPCNPCAMKHANPCNPCDMKKMKKHANPCNPCDMKKMKKMNPCNPCSMKRGQ